MRQYPLTNVRKTTGAVVWDEQVYSQQRFTGGAYASARAQQADCMFGFNADVDPSTGSSYVNIYYGWYVAGGNSLQIYESGVQVYAGGVWAAGDLLEIIYSGTTVTYLKNGVVVRQPTVSAGLSFWFDSSYYQNGEFRDIRFGPNAGQVSGTFVASAGMNLAQGVLSRLAGPGYDIHLQSESQDADGVWQPHNTLGNVDWLTAFKYRGDADSNIVTGSLELARADRTLSMAPLVQGSTINRKIGGTYAPFLDAERRVRVRNAIMPRGIAPYSGIGGTWSSSGVTVAGSIAAVNDGNPTGQVFHTDTAVPGAYIQVDAGTPTEFDQVRVWAQSAPASIWKIQGSPDATTWIDIRTGFATNKAGDNIFFFPRWSYRYWRLTLTNTPGAGPYYSEVQFNRDWREIFDGYIDKVGVSGRDENAVIAQCRDLGALLIDTDIEVIRQYGSSGGTAVETVMQSILDDNLGAGVVTLYTPVSPMWNVHEFSQKLTSVMDAIRTLAKQIGYEVRYLYDINNVPRLTFYAPDRLKVISDYGIGPTIYTDVTSLDIDGADVRNAWTVEYIDRATGNKLTAIATSAPSIAQYKRRPAKIAYGYTSNIDSATEAQKMVDAALADTAFPKAVEVIDMMYWPLIDTADLITLIANGEHYDTDQQRAVVAWEHDLRDGDGTTALTTRGKPGGGYTTWMSMVGGILDGPSLTVVDIPGANPAANHTITYTGSWDTIQLSINGAAWFVPGASPLTVTPNAAGGATKVYSFRAIKNGQIVTQNVSIEPPAPLPPQALIVHLNTETDDTVWNLQANAVVGSGGGGANLTWVAYVKIGFAAEVSFSSGNATALPASIPVNRDPRSDKVVRLTLTDALTGLTDSARITVPSQRPEVNNTAHPWRVFPLDDGHWSARSPVNTGLQLHSSMVDTRSAFINTMFRNSVDTADVVLDGGSRRAIPYTTLRASDNALMTRVDYTAVVGDAQAALMAKRHGIWFSEVFDQTPLTQGYGLATTSPTGTLVSTVGVAAVGSNVYQFTKYEWWIYPYFIQFNPSKLYRLRVRYRVTVDAGTAGSRGVYIGLQCFDASGAAANSNSGYNYVAVSGDTPTVAQGWKEVTTWVRGATVAFGTGSGPSTAAIAPSALNVNTVLVKPQIGMNYPMTTGTTDATMQIDYFQVDEMDEDISNRSYNVINSTGNIVRGRTLDDAQWALKSSLSDGRRLAVTDTYDDASGQYMSTAFFRSFHSLDNVNDGGSWKRVAGINASNFVTPSSTIGRGTYQAYNAGGQTLTTGTTPVQLTLDTAQFALGTGVTRSGNQLIINDSIATNGTWVCVAQVGFAANATGDRHVEIRKNGTVIGQATIKAATAATFVPPVVAFTQVALSDALDVYVWENSGGNLAIVVGGGATFFSMTHLW